MSIHEFEEACKIIEAHKNEAYFCGTRKEESIERAEQVLALKFPPTYRQFLIKFGSGDVTGEEFYGLTNNENYEKATIPNSIWLSLKHRRTSGLPDKLVIIYATGYGMYYALDCRVPDSDGECPVVVWNPGISQAGDKLEKVANDFGEFFYQTIKNALSNRT